MQHTKTSDVIRAALAAKLEADASNLNRVHLETGVAYASLHKFVRGDNVRSDVLDVLAEYVGASTSYSLKRSKRSK